MIADDLKHERESDEGHDDWYCQSSHFAGPRFRFRWYCIFSWCVSADVNLPVKTAIRQCGTLRVIVKSAASDGVCSISS